MTNSAGWLIVLISGIGCFVLKLAGYAIPPRFLAQPRLRGALELMPVALLAGLIVVQTLASGHHLTVDGPRLAGVAVAAVCIKLRADFLVVVVSGAATAALLRLV